MNQLVVRERSPDLMHSGRRMTESLSAVINFSIMTLAGPSAKANITTMNYYEQSQIEWLGKSNLLMGKINVYFLKLFMEKEKST